MLLSDETLNDLMVKHIPWIIIIKECYIIQMYRVNSLIAYIQEKEKESWQAASQSLNWKLEVAESNCIRAEIEAAKMKSIISY